MAKKEQWEIDRDNRIKAEKAGMGSLDQTAILKYFISNQ